MLKEKISLKRLVGLSQEDGEKTFTCGRIYTG